MVIVLVVCLWKYGLIEGFDVWSNVLYLMVYFGVVWGGRLWVGFLFLFVCLVWYVMYISGQPGFRPRSMGFWLFGLCGVGFHVVIYIVTWHDVYNSESTHRVPVHDCYYRVTALIGLAQYWNKLEAFLWKFNVIQNTTDISGSVRMSWFNNNSSFSKEALTFSWAK